MKDRFGRGISYVRISVTPQCNLKCVYCISKSPNFFQIISSVSHGFCENCNRLRLTSDGFIRSCLTQDLEINVREALRNGSGNNEIAELFKKAVLLKPERGDFHANTKRRM